MTEIETIVHALDETTVARRVGIQHDEARVRYRLRSNTVSDWQSFETETGNYYQYHHGACVSRGGHLSGSDARGAAKSVLEQEYRRRRSDILGAFADARDGTNGGLRTVLDAIADGLKAESIAHYATDVFDRTIPPDNYEKKVEIIREFIARFGAQLGEAVVASRPERYAQNYRELIEAYVSGLRQTSAMFRRL